MDATKETSAKLFRAMMTIWAEQIDSGMCTTPTPMTPEMWAALADTAADRVISEKGTAT